MIREIIEAWAKVIFHTEEEKAKAEENLKICMSCPSKRDGAYLSCGECGCPLAGKVYSSCPLGKF